MDYFDDWDDDEYDDGLGNIRRGKKWDKIAYDPSKHYPNKHESECLRRIMAQSGLTEEEVRANKTYRIELSKAREEGVKAKRSQTTKWCQNVVKRACQKTGLVPQHPETLKVLDEMLNDRYGSAWGVPFGLVGRPNAKTIVRNYAK